MTMVDRRSGRSNWRLKISLYVWKGLNTMEPALSLALSLGTMSILQQTVAATFDLVAKEEVLAGRSRKPDSPGLLDRTGTTTAADRLGSWGS